MRWSNHAYTRHYDLNGSQEISQGYISQANDLLAGRLHYDVPEGLGEQQKQQLDKELRAKARRILACSRSRKG